MIEAPTIFPKDTQPTEKDNFPTSYYQALHENQKLWREAKRDIGRPHEMPKVAERIEKTMKKVFKKYIDPEYPQTITAWSLLKDVPKEEVPYINFDWRFPEDIKPEDKERYKHGIYLMNEWATNYATIYYLEHASHTPLTKPIRKTYGQMTRLLYELPLSQTSKMMREVKKTAKTNKVDFNHALFSAYFKHEFTMLNTLITQTPSVSANTIDTLALEIAKNMPIILPSSQESLLSHPTDSAWKGTLKRAALSYMSGVHERPGTAEIIAGKPITAAINDGLFGALIGLFTPYELPAIATGVGIGASIHTLGLPYVTVHESVHSYASSENYVGLIPSILIKGPGEETITQKK